MGSRIRRCKISSCFKPNIIYPFLIYGLEIRDMAQNGKISVILCNFLKKRTEKWSNLARVHHWLHWSAYTGWAIKNVMIFVIRIIDDSIVLREKDFSWLKYSNLASIDVPWLWFYWQESPEVLPVKNMLFLSPPGNRQSAFINPNTALRGKKNLSAIFKKIIIFWWSF